MVKSAHIIWFLVLSIALVFYWITDFGNAAELSSAQKNIYSLIAPIAIAMVIIELVYCALTQKDYISYQESVVNFGTALGNQTTNLLVAVAVYFTYGWLWENFQLFHLPLDWEHWYNSILLLVGIDFLFYWFHRFGHEVNILWAAHSPHHSAEEMNILVGLRASVTQRLLSFVFLWPLTIIGFTPFDVYMMTGLHLFMSLWHHTEVIPKFWRWIEFFFNTPSHHRVHHGVNFQYLDKNFSEMLIIWDRLFGTFEEEHEKVVYGMYDGPQSWNPIKINFHYYIQLWNLAVAAPYWTDKIKIWFMPLTWRPRGLPEYVPNEEITLENQIRYQSNPFDKSKTYILLHLILCLALMAFIISPGLGWTTLEKWIGAALLWHTIVNLSGILEARPWLYASEMMRLPFLCLIVLLFNNWYANPVAVGVAVLVAVVSMYWTHLYFRTDQKPLEEVENVALEMV
jgi:sterol desaturase/sphingolipid hydroxylase (fatty acid hydroxylase superfamily)